MKKFYYNNLSPGYVGIENSEPQTVNSQFFLNFWRKVETEGIPETYTLYPQRVPRAGFFSEILDNESPEFLNFWNVKVNTLKDRVQNHFKNQPMVNSFTMLNASNALLRLGEFSYLSKHINTSVQNEINDLNLEMLLIKHTATINHKLSVGEKPNTQDLYALYKLAVDKKNISKTLSIKLANRFLVSAIRYKDTGVSLKELLATRDWLTDELENFTPTDFNSGMLMSVCYRGLAMSPSENSDFKWSCLNRAKCYALSLNPTCEQEILLKKENLITLFQTLSKTSATDNMHHEAEDYLKKMHAIDPLDSVSNIELGFYYLNKSEYIRAYHFFESSFTLGPPSLGMSAYFAGKCQYELKNFTFAIDWFNKSVRYDKESVSALLDLIKIYEIQKNSTEVQSIATYILNEPNLHEQLNTEESMELKNILLKS